jgi:hypothetical protein
MSLTRVSRSVRGFDASGELKSEYLLPNSWTLERLRERFETADDDPMFDSFPLEPRQASALVTPSGKISRLPGA